MSRNQLKNTWIIYYYWGISPIDGHKKHHHNLSVDIHAVISNTGDAFVYLVAVSHLHSKMIVSTLYKFIP